MSFKARLNCVPVFYRQLEKRRCIIIDLENQGLIKIQLYSNKELTESLLEIRLIASARTGATETTSILPESFAS